MILRLSLLMLAAAFARPVAAQALPADLAAVPPTALGFVHIRVADAVKHKAFADYRAYYDKAGAKAIAAFDGQFAPRPSSLDRVTLVALPGGQPDESFKLVVQFTQPFDLDAVRASFLPKAQRIKGLREVVYLDENSNMMICAAGPQTLVVGPGRALFPDDKLVAAGDPATHPLKADLAAAADGTKIVYGVVDVSKLPLPPDAFKEIPEPFRPLAAAKRVTVSVALTEGVTASLKVEYADADAAMSAEKSMKLGAAELRKLLAQARPKVEAMLFDKTPAKGFRPPDELGDAFTALSQIAALNYADDLLGDLPVTRAGNALALSTTGPISATAFAGYSAVAVGLLLPAVQKTREAAARMSSTNNLKQIALAMHSYHDAMGTLPPAAITDKAGKPLLSWRVAVLPYLEQQALYNKFRLDEPWDSKTNLPLSKITLKVYSDPRLAVGPGLTYYKVFTGPDAGFPLLKGRKLPQIPDGTSNTLMAVAAGDPVPWSKPEDFAFDKTKPAPDLSRPFNTVLAAMMDGSVRAIDPAVFVKNKDLLKWLIDPADGNVLPPF